MENKTTKNQGERYKNVSASVKESVAIQRLKDSIKEFNSVKEKSAVDTTLLRLQLENSLGIVKDAEEQRKREFKTLSQKEN